MDFLPPLPEKEQRKLFIAMHNGDIEARNTIFLHNLVLVNSICKRIYPHLEFNDKFQTGSVALICAIDSYDIKRNIKFVSYATPSITGYIKNYNRHSGNLIKKSRSLYPFISLVKDTKERLAIEQGIVDASPELIAAELNVSREEVIEAIVASYCPLSFNQLVNSIQTEDFTDKIVDRVTLQQLLSALTEDERKLILDRYVKGKSQLTIANELNTYQQEISRKEKKIFRKLQSKI